MTDSKRKLENQPDRVLAINRGDHLEVHKPETVEFWSEGLTQKLGESKVHRF
jgi:hypothetical protein